jgi:HlyD family secretion protein
MPDMTVSVDLTVARRSQAWLLPSDAIRGGLTPSPWVWAVEAKRVRRRPIKLGLRGDGSSEILSGLAPGAEIVLAGGLALREGMRVQGTPGDP